MNVIVMMGGREAIPVRAVPFLTDWEVLSPDALALALAGDDDFFSQFEALQAHRIEGDAVKPVNRAWWGNVQVKRLQAVDDRIRSAEISHATGLAEWRYASIADLPPGVFLWRDEFEQCFWSKFGPDGETVFKLTASGEFERQKRNEAVQLDYDPFIPDANVRGLVMEGFELANPQAATPAPVVSRGTPRALTDEQEIEIVRLYNRSRGASVNSLAKQFGVSNPTIDKALKRAGVKN